MVLQTRDSWSQLSLRGTISICIRGAGSKEEPGLRSLLRPPNHRRRQTRKVLFIEDPPRTRWGASCFCLTHGAGAITRAAPPPNQRPLSRFPKLGVGGGGAPRVGRLAVGSERATWPRCRRASVRKVAQRRRDGTTRRWGARPRPPGPAPAPWPAAPPPRGVPGRSSPRRRPRAARGRREYSRGRPVGRLPAGPGGAGGPRKGCGARLSSAGADEVRGLDRVALRGPPGLDRLRSRLGG